MFAQDMKQRLVVPLNSPNKTGMLKIDLINGSISVSGYDGKDVIVEASARQKVNNDCNSCPDDKKDDTNKNGMTRIPNLNLGLEITEDDNVIKVNSESWKRAIDLEIKVPYNFSVDLKTVNNGKITVSNINGEIEVSNINGNVTLSDVSGSGIVNTVNGKIIANFKKVVANTPMSFTSLNGSIEVAFPADIKATAKIKSEMGEIYTDYKMEVESKAEVKESKGKGSTKISFGQWTYGKINGGGAEITFKNMHGNIYIKKAN
ncbi:MAG: hypothetical protein EAZ08_04940 [Cytophagales bacterium]|nr:MAG: hypothetical protein EAZ08_04940 [Cytophagales bacterium]